MAVTHPNGQAQGCLTRVALAYSATYAHAIPCAFAHSANIIHPPLPQKGPLPPPPHIACLHSPQMSGAQDKAKLDAKLGAVLNSPQASLSRSNSDFNRNSVTSRTLSSSPLSREDLGKLQDRLKHEQEAAAQGIDPTDLPPELDEDVLQMLRDNFGTGAIALNPVLKCNIMRHALRRRFHSRHAPHSGDNERPMRGLHRIRLLQVHCTRKRCRRCLYSAYNCNNSPSPCTRKRCSRCLSPHAPPSCARARKPVAAHMH